MLNEKASRVAGFRAGTPVRLLDGQEWVFPGPGEMAEASRSQPGRGGVVAGGSPDPEFEPLLHAVACAEDRPERSLAELALAIFLLAANYELGPEDYLLLLESPPGDPRGAALRGAFHELAEGHLRHFRSRPAGRPSPSPRPGLFGRVRALIRGHRVEYPGAGDGQVRQASRGAGVDY